jgi:hypothetical protein
LSPTPSSASLFPFFSDRPRFDTACFIQPVQGVFALCKVYRQFPIDTAPDLLPRPENGASDTLFRSNGGGAEGVGDARDPAGLTTNCHERVQFSYDPYPIKATQNGRPVKKAGCHFCS